MINDVWSERETVPNEKWFDIVKEKIDFSQYENFKLLLGDRPVKQLPEQAAFTVLDDRLAKYLNPEDLTDKENLLVQGLAKEYSGGIIDERQE